MKMKFNEFIDKKGRENKHQLKVVKKVLEHNGFTVDEFLNDKSDVYIFLHAPDDRLSFEGVRIYKIGDILAYRVQKEKDTHPYGKAYPLDVEGMFNDLMSEGGKEKQSGERVIKGIIGEFQHFFTKSLEAEKELKSSDVQDDRKDGMGSIVNKSSMLDYATSISNRLSI